MNLQLLRAATATWWKKRQHIPPITAAAGTPRKNCRKIPGNTQKHKWKGVLIQPNKTAPVLWRRSEARLIINHIRRQWQISAIQSQQNKIKTSRNRSVSSGSHYKQ
jgi:hypothetical protein